MNGIEKRESEVSPTFSTLCTHLNFPYSSLCIHISYSKIETSMQRGSLQCKKDFLKRSKGKKICHTRRIMSFLGGSGVIFTFFSTPLHIVLSVIMSMH